MGKRPDPPKEASAPAYFIQYAALWCIMLAFFVVLLTMGHERTDAFKAGVGFIRDAFGLKGGLGMLPFWRRSVEGQGDNSPILKKKPEEGDIIGNFKGLLWKQGLSSVAILQTEFDDRGVSITVDTPIAFSPDSAVLNRDACVFLSRIGTLFVNLPGSLITVSCLTTNQADDNANLLLAAERVAAITRYLKEQSRIGGDRLEAVAFAHDRYFQSVKWTNANRSVLFTIRKLKEETKPPMTTLGAVL